MSITVSNCNQICSSPLNLSPSKNLWTFSKQHRFAESQVITCAKAFYDLPAVADQRKAGIGKGTKYDFTKFVAKTPGPNQYPIKSGTDYNLDKHKGFQFGVSREKMMQTSILGSINKANPGPGQYELGNTLSKTRYTFRPKLNDDIMVSNRFVPGPGAYPILPSINENGRYVNSKFQNSGATKINPSSKRFVDTYETKVPGPGNYKIDFTGMSKDGKYQLSNQKSSLCRSFPHEMRRTGSTGHFDKTPGPGAYRLPSDFGYYESAHKSTTSINKTQE